jgi:glyoxylase-like metal-dependent hydrolase (beta-lactamase superfamily II)
MPVRHLRGNVYLVGGGSNPSINIKGLSAFEDSAVMVIKAEDGNHAGIELGSGVGHEEIARNTAEIGVDWYGIKTFYGSHEHSDHIWGFAYAHEQAVLRLGAAGVEAVRDGDHDRDASFLMPHVTPPTLDPERIEPIREGHEAQFGSTVLRVIETADHTPGSIGIYLATSEGIIYYPGDSHWMGGSPIVGTDWDRWKQNYDEVPKKGVFDCVMLGHCMTDVIENGMENWRIGKKMFLSDFKLSHKGLYIHPYGDQSNPASWKYPSEDERRAVEAKNIYYKTVFDQRAAQANRPVNAHLLDNL